MRKSVAAMLVLVFLTASSIITFLPAKAEDRAIVVPDDYPTIAAAVGNATQGDTIFVKKGTYKEYSLVINKTLSLIGEDANNTVIKNIDSPVWTPGDPFFPPNPIAVQISADNTEISGFTVTGVYASYVPICVVADRAQIISNIIEPKGNGISVNGNNNTVAHNSALGLGNGFIGCTGSYNTIAGNNLTGHTGGGLNIGGSFNVVYGNNITNSGLFGSIEVSGEGNIVAKNNLTNSGGIRIVGSLNTAFANVMKGSGFSVVGYNNTFYANYLTYDLEMGDGLRGDAANNVFYHNNFAGNNRIIINTAVRGPNYFDNDVEGNFWSGYRGEDANGDGIGDIPYVIDSSRQDGYPLMAPFDISSLDVQLPEWASVAFRLEQRVSVLSPQNVTYTTVDVPLNFTVPQSARWVHYSLDGEENVTAAGNTTLTGLANGAHNLTLYVDDPFGNTTPTEPIHFTIEEPFPTVPVAAAFVATVAVVGVGLLVYFKKRKR